MQGFFTFNETVRVRNLG